MVQGPDPHDPRHGWVGVGKRMSMEKKEIYENELNEIIYVNKKSTPSKFPFPLKSLGGFSNNYNKKA